MSSSTAPASDTRTHFRWIVCTLLVLSTTINYMDRQVISYLKEFFCAPISQGGFGWSNSDYANVTAYFTLFYAGMTMFAGLVIDKIGTKLGLALSLIVWSVFGILNAFVGSLVWIHVVIRSLFAVGEAGNFPASIKTVAEWFPKRERALATGIFNSGSNIGAMISAIFVPWCMTRFGDQQGWKLSYILTGSIGFLWLIFWFWLYDTPAKQKRLSAAEFELIHADDKAEPASTTTSTTKASWYKLLGYRQTWSFISGKLLTDGVWWFYLFWLPDYLHKQFGMTKEQVTVPTFIVYGVAIIGSVYGGSIPMTLIKKGMPVYRARMTAMFIIAIVPLSVLATQYVGNVERFGQLASVLAVGVICLAAAAHQAWSANLFTTVSDMFPKKAVASVTGIGAAAGGLGGYITQKIAGALTDAYRANPQTAYLIMFAVCGFSYVAAWALMKVFVPRHRTITDL